MLAQSAFAPGDVCHLAHKLISTHCCDSKYVVSCSSIATQPAEFEGLEGFNLDKSDVLFNVLTDCRVVRLT